MLKPAGPKRDMVMYKASSGADIEFTWGLDLKLTETRCANRDLVMPHCSGLGRSHLRSPGTSTTWCPLYANLRRKKKDEASNDADMRIRGIHELIAWDSKE